MNTLSKNTWLHYYEIALLACAPVAFCYCLLFFFGFHWFDFSPFYSDEVHYWNEISTMRAVGFSGGYSVINEVPAKLGWSGFGPHGPGFALAAYPYSMLFGWLPHSPILLNAVWLTLAIFSFLVIAPTARNQRLAMTAFLATCFPVLLFLPTGMQESLHQSIGIILAGFIAYRMDSFIHEDKPRYSGVVQGTAISLFLFFTLIRSLWGILFFVFVISSLSREKPFKMRLAQGCLVLFASVFWMGYLYSPVVATGQLEYFVLALTQLDPSGAQIFLSNAGYNAAAFFSYKEADGFVAILLRYEIVALIVFLAYALSSESKKKSPGPRLTVIRTSLNILLASVLLVIFLYQVGSWRDYRILAPSLISAALVTALLDRRAIFIWILVVVQSGTLWLALPTFRAFRANNFTALTEIEKTNQSAIANSIIFKPEASRWCNTILVFVQDYDLTRTWNISSGIGITVVHDAERLRRPIQSRYVFLAHEPPNSSKLSGTSDMLHPIVEMGAGGTIFENGAVTCL